MKEPPLPSPADGVLLAAFLGLILTSALAWCYVVQRGRAGEPILAQQPRAAVPWGLFDVCGALVLFLCLVVGAVQLFAACQGLEMSSAEDLSLNVQVQLFVIDSAAKLLSLVLVVVWLRMRYVRPWFDLGWIANPRQAAIIGAVGFALAALPVYAIQAGLSQMFPAEHPLIKLLKEDPQPAFFLVGAVAAVVVAPLFEEYFVRVLLQGWLENIARREFSTEQLLLGESALQPMSSTHLPQAPGVSSASTNAPAIVAGLAPPVSAALEATVESSGPPLAADVSQAAEPEVAASSPALPFRTWPIVVSSALFALLHLGHGPDPIPLFFLALGLGYMYQRTGSVWPGVAMHAFFNAWSMGLLWVHVSFG